MTVLIFIIIAIAVLLADQGTKHVALAQLSQDASVPLIPGLAQLTLTTNTGAAFSLLPHATEFLAGVALVAAISIVVYVTRYQASLDRLVTVALGLALGGACGNLLDRVVRHYVVDFLDFYVGTHHWPVFNVADACICTGVGLLALKMLRSGNDEPSGEQPAADSE